MDCSNDQGARLANPSVRRLATLAEVDDDVPEPVGFDVDDATWDVAWLKELRDVPDSATWPRLMSPPHPDAVGSFGAEAVRWLRAEAGITARWWQQLALARQFEHDKAGALVWLEVLLSTSRQSGKSTVLRGGATWRLHQADRFGEEQTLLHTGKDLPVCKEVQRLARAWAKARSYPVREQNGNEQITEPVSGSRWIVRGKGSVYGYPGSAVLADEAWGIDPEVVEDGLEPTMAERLSPQMLLASTAHRKATPLFPTRRAAALADLATPSNTLLLEWSAPRRSSIDDRSAWRLASPHWSPGRERLLEARLRRVLDGRSIDVDEDDPIESFRAQFLNIWPKLLPRTVQGRLWILAGDWDACADPSAAAVPPDGEVALALDAGPELRHATIAMAFRLPDGRTCVKGVEGFVSADGAVLARAAQRLAELVAAWSPRVACVAVRSGSESEAAALRALEALDVTPVVPVSSAELGRAANAFHEAVVARTVVHPDDLMIGGHLAAVTAEGILRRRSAGADVDAAVAATLARHGVGNAPARVVAQDWMAF